MRRLVLRAGLFLAPLGFLAASPLAAQDQVYVVRGSPAWLGISYELGWVQAGDGCAPRVRVESVVQGSPADRAGLRAGDAIVAVNDEPVPPGRLQALASGLVPGDSVTVRFLRDGATREVTAVAGRRPDRPLQVFLEERSGLYRSRAPVVELTGGTLAVSNVSPDWDPSRTRSYWVRTGGETEYRMVSPWSRSALDERVERLFECADSVQASTRIRLHTDGSAGTLRQVQQRADSLRLLITRRALRRDSLQADTVGVVLRNRVDSATVRFFRPENAALTLRVEDHVAVGLRGVAGAELTPLEPDLAAYFRNADQGLLILRIAPGTPADQAGLRPGDVLIAADGRRVRSVGELRRIIALPQAGAVELRVVRHGRTRNLTLRRN